MTRYNSAEEASVLDSLVLCNSSEAIKEVRLENDDTIRMDVTSIVGKLNTTLLFKGWCTLCKTGIVGKLNTILLFLLPDHP